MAAEFDMPFCEQPPSPQTKIGYFSLPFMSAGRKIVPVLIPGEQLYSTITSCGPLPDTFAPVGWDTAQLPWAGAAPAAPCPGAAAAPAVPRPCAETLQTLTVIPSIPTRIHFEDFVILMSTPRSRSRVRSAALLPQFNIAGFVIGKPIESRNGRIKRLDVFAMKPVAVVSGHKRQSDRD